MCLFNPSLCYKSLSLSFSLVWTLSGLRQLVVWVKLFFSFHYEGEEYPCALVEWFKKIGRSPEEQTGMWVVRPESDNNSRKLASVIHIDTILRGAHLLPVYGKSFLPLRFHCTWSLDSFKSFFVNKFADHHANEIAF